MWGLKVAASLVVAAVVMPGVRASAARPGLSWCSESTLDNFRIPKERKPELSQIKVVVNNTFMQDVVDEVFIRQQAPCEGITQEEVIHIDGENAALVLRDDGEIGLFWTVPDTMPIFQEVDDFCILVTNPNKMWGTFLAKFCFPNATLQLEQDLQFCSDVTCVRKCCPPQMALASSTSCGPVPDGEGWRPSLASNDSGAGATPVHMLYGPPRLCEKALLYQEFSILPSGMVALEQMTMNVDINGYCIDTFQHSPQEMALVCLDKVAPAWHCEWKTIFIKPVLLGVSSVCLIITWLVYVSIAKLRSLNEGRCLLSLVSALFVAYVTLIILNFTASEEASTSCVVTGRLCHFALLASYFWMNVLSFHTFVQLRSQMDDKWESPLVFFLYSLYAWGCPLVVMVVGVTLDAVQSDAIRPYIDYNCWFIATDRPAFFAYLYGPMLVLLLVNVVFFVGCVVLLLCCRRRVTFSPSTGQLQNFGAWVYVRLFILMGILWLTEVVSWHYLQYCSIPEYIIDIINSLQGVYIFLVTVTCRRNLKVFHCGRPKLVQAGRHGEITTTTGEESEMAANPLVK